MPIDRNHAFANENVFSCPSWILLQFGKLLIPFKYLFSKILAIQVWYQFKNNCVIANDVLLGSRAWCINGLHDRVRIQLNSKVVCRGLLKIEKFGNGSIVICRNVYMGDDCIISCANRVEIGDYTLIAHGVQIFDNDSHPINWRFRQIDWDIIMNNNNQSRMQICSAPICIGSYVWIGLNSIILKGVTIGEKSIIAAGSVVTSDIPANVIAGGNPARVLKSNICSDDL